MHAYGEQLRDNQVLVYIKLPEQQCKIGIGLGVSNVVEGLVFHGTAIHVMFMNGCDQCAIMR